MFQLQEKTLARIDNLTSRQQNAGKDEKVAAVSIRFIVKAPNTILRLFGDDVLGAIYWHGDTKTIPGVDDIPTKLRTTAITRHEIRGKLEGCTVRFHQATDSDERPTKLVLGSCKVDAFSVLADDGGSVALTFRVGTDDIKAAGAYVLEHNGNEVEITLEAPALADEKPTKTEKKKAKDATEKVLAAEAAGQNVIDGTR
jgi:hypothetical protein